MISKKEIEDYKGVHRTIMRGEDFIYLLPHSGLHKFVSNYTITFPSDYPADYSVIPHGSATLVFSCNGENITGTLFGPISKMCRVGDSPNHSQMLFIIEFQPGGLYAFTGIPQKELLNDFFPVEFIHPKLSKSMERTLRESISVHELITRADEMLLTYACKDSPAELNMAVCSIIDSLGNRRNKELSQITSYSERHLNRIFDRHLGMSTKSFSRLVRINKAIHLFHNQNRSITASGELTGFYDLPHFIHEFRSTCDMTPQEYLENMSTFYSEIAKF